MSKLTVIKKIKIKSTNSFRVTIPESFILNNDVRIGDELIMFIADTDELIIRKIKKEK